MSLSSAVAAFLLAALHPSAKIHHAFVVSPHSSDPRNHHDVPGPTLAPDLGIEAWLPCD